MSTTRTLAAILAAGALGVGGSAVAWAETSTPTFTLVFEANDSSATCVPSDGLDGTVLITPENPDVILLEGTLRPGDVYIYPGELAGAGALTPYTLQQGVAEVTYVDTNSNVLGSTTNLPSDCSTGPTDTDGDGVPDTTDPDDDNDGYTDEEELAAGSDPLDPNSVPDAGPIALNPEDFTVGTPVNGSVSVTYDGAADTSLLVVSVPVRGGGNVTAQFDGDTAVLDVAELKPGRYPVYVQYIGDDEPVKLGDVLLKPEKPSKPKPPKSDTGQPGSPGNSGGQPGTPGTPPAQSGNNGGYNGNGGSSMPLDNSATSSGSGSALVKGDPAKKAPPANAAPLGDDTPAYKSWSWAAIAALLAGGRWLGGRMEVGS